MATGSLASAAPARLLGLRLRLSRLGARRFANFRANRRGWVSLHVFTGLFVFSLFANIIANDRPLLVRYDGAFYVPVLVSYPETTFGGFFPTEADYRDPEVEKLIRAKGWIVWPPIPYSYDTVTTRSGRPGALAALGPALARHRRPGARRGRPGDLRLSHLGAVRSGADDPELAHRHRCRRRAGLSSAASSTSASSASWRSGAACPSSIS